MKTASEINRQRATPSQGAAEFETTTPTFLSWYHKGIIPAEVATGRVFRFDLDRCAEALREHAAKLQKGGRK